MAHQVLWTMKGLAVFPTFVYQMATVATKHSVSARTTDAPKMKRRQSFSARIRNVVGSRTMGEGGAGRPTFSFPNLHSRNQHMPINRQD